MEGVSLGDAVFECVDYLNADLECTLGSGFVSLLFSWLMLAFGHLLGTDHPFASV